MISVSTLKHALTIFETWLQICGIHTYLTAINCWPKQNSK